MDSLRTMQFHKGEMTDAFEAMGCSFNEVSERAAFRLYAPHADEVQVIGDFNAWKADKNSTMRKLTSGIFELDMTGVKEFDRYLYRLHTRKGWLERPDPYGAAGSAEGYSMVYSKKRIASSGNSYIEYVKQAKNYRGAVSIYSAHIGSWRKTVDGRPYFYDKFCDEMLAYLKEMRYTHIELVGLVGMRLDENGKPAPSGYYLPDPRHGDPKDFCRLIDKFHKNGIGVILSIPAGSFFPVGAGLHELDGTPLFGERPDPFDPGKLAFSFERGEVRTFLTAALHMWLSVYMIDGLRLEGLSAVMRPDPAANTPAGAEERLQGAVFVKQLVAVLKAKNPHAILILEDGSGDPALTRPQSEGGCGFDYIWNPSLSADTLSVVMPAAFTPPNRAEGVSLLDRPDAERPDATLKSAANWILPMSYDTLTKERIPLMSRLPGVSDMRPAILRVYYMYVYAHPGKKHLFMGNEFGQVSAWNGVDMPEWQLLRSLPNQSLHSFVKTLNALYTGEGAVLDDGEAANWLAAGDLNRGVFALTRRTADNTELLCVFNLSGIEQKNLSLGVARGSFVSVLSSDPDGFTVKPKPYRTQKKTQAGAADCLVLDLGAYSGLYLLRQWEERPYRA